MLICKLVIQRFGIKVGLLSGVGARKFRRRRQASKDCCRVIPVLKLAIGRRKRGGKRSRSRDRKVRRRV